MITFAKSFLKKKRIYLDYAASTPVLNEVQRVMVKAIDIIGNPSSIHKEGVEAAIALTRARAAIALQLACKPRDIVFTSGGTEANNLAILGYARDLMRKLNGRSDLPGGGPTSSRDHSSPLLHGTHWIVSSIEHPSVLESFSEIEQLGGEVSFIDPDSRGLISVERLAQILRPQTVFVSIGWANGEIGIVQSIQSLTKTIRAYEKKHGTRIIFHTDAGQAPLYKVTHVHSLGVDLMTLDSTKLYGPRGCAVLYVGSSVDLKPILHGGGQERHLRPGTENVVSIIGFAKAFGIVSARRTRESDRLKTMRDMLLEILNRALSGIIVNTDIDRALPHILSISVPNINSEYFTLSLDAHGIAISTKSACREGEEQKSRVVDMLGGPEWRAKNTLRLSLGYCTTAQDMEYVAQTLIMIYLQMEANSNTGQNVFNYA